MVANRWIRCRRQAAPVRQRPRPHQRHRVLLALFKRAFHGTYHHLMRKRVQRHVDEFVWRNNSRWLATLERMQQWAAALYGKRLNYAELVA
ncbi:MAG: transposase [Chloroflexi bacterium]|nr:transposase [Chloroflexota bacterium]